MPYRRLSWHLPWTLTCPVHEIFLTRALVLPGRTWSVIEERPFGRATPEADLLRLDRTTHQAVTRGIVETPAGRIAGGTWVRLLRAVIEELAYVVPDGSPRGAGIAELWADCGRCRHRPRRLHRSSPYQPRDRPDDDGTGGHDTLVSIENGSGSNHNNVIIGNTGKNTISGCGGADTMTGGGLDPQWTPEATGDFTGDSKADILWRNTVTNETGLWQMDGFQVNNYRVLDAIPNE